MSREKESRKRNISPESSGKQNKKTKNINFVSMLRGRETGLRRKKTILYNIKSFGTFRNILKLNPKIQIIFIHKDDDKIKVDRFEDIRQDPYAFQGQEPYYTYDENGEQHEHLYSTLYVAKNVKRHPENSNDFSHYQSIGIDDYHIYSSKQIFIDDKKQNLYYITYDEENIKKYIDMRGYKLIFDGDDIKEFTQSIDSEADKIQSASYNYSYSLTEQSGSGLKYIKYLKSKSTQKLQQIAKGKNIEYMRKYKGKIVEIKRETLQKKLLKKYLDAKK